MPRLNKPHNNGTISLLGASKSRRNVTQLFLNDVPELKNNAAGDLGGSHIYQDSFCPLIRSQRGYYTDLKRHNDFDFCFPPF